MDNTQRETITFGRFWTRIGSEEIKDEKKKQILYRKKMKKIERKIIIKGIKSVEISEVVSRKHEPEVV